MKKYIAFVCILFAVIISFGSCSTTKLYDSAVFYLHSIDTAQLINAKKVKPQRCRINISQNEDSTVSLAIDIEYTIPFAIISKMDSITRRTTYYYAAIDTINSFLKVNGEKIKFKLTYHNHPALKVKAQLPSIRNYINCDSILSKEPNVTLKRRHEARQAYEFTWDDSPLHIDLQLVIANPLSLTQVEKWITPRYQFYLQQLIKTGSYAYSPTYDYDTRPFQEYLSTNINSQVGERTYLDMDKVKFYTLATITFPIWLPLHLAGVKIGD